MLIMSRLIPLMLLLLTACTPVKESPSPAQSRTAQTTTVTDKNSNTSTTLLRDERLTEPRQVQVQEGSGQFIKESRAARFSQNNDNVTLNFESVELADFMKVVLGEVLKVNYSISPDISGKVTIQTPEPVSHDEVISLAESVLAMHEASLLVDDGFYRVVPKADSVGMTSLQTSVDGAGFGVYVLTLKHIAAAEMFKILEPYMGEDTDIQIDRRRNLLLVRGHRQQVQSLRESVALFDVDWLKGMSVGMYPLENAEAAKVKAELEAILAGNDPEAEPLGGLIKLVSIDRLNAILAISPDKSSLSNVELWLNRLDVASVQGQQKLYVYKVQNAKAVQLADVLSRVFGIEMATSRMAEQRTLAPGETMMTQDQTQQASSLTQPNSRQAAMLGNELTQSRLLTNPVEIIADDVRNALVIMATPKDYEMILDTMTELDTVPLQVLIEASIVEVTLSDELSYGVEWFFKNSAGGHQGLGALDLGETGISALSPSFSFTVVDSLSNVRFALNALAAESKLNVLSSPSLMVLDNQAARINVGDEIPIPVRQSTSNLDPDAPTVNEIDFRKTGVTLTVLPRVNNSGLVTMEIRQEVSNAVQTTTSSLDAPTIQSREIESVVAINSGETIVLGGLIQDSTTNNESGLPGLHSLPVVGHLFGQTRDEKRRTELLVLITPRVVRDRTESRLITDELRRKMQNIEPSYLPEKVDAEVSG